MGSVDLKKSAVTEGDAQAEAGLSYEQHNEIGRRSYIQRFKHQLEESRSFGSINHLLAVAVIFIAVLVLGMAYAFRRSQEGHFRREAYVQLLAVAELKVREIVTWRNERKADTLFFMNSRLFVETVVRWLEAPNPKDESYILDTWDSITHYTDNILFNVHGTVLLSRLGLKTQADEYSREGIKMVLKTQLPFIGDLVLREDGKPTVGVFYPILKKDNSGYNVVVAVVGCELDPERSLYPLLESWPGERTSAEILLVKREGDSAVFINRLRHYAGPAFSLKLPMTSTRIPAVAGLLGHKGILEGPDYRGHPVLAAIRPVPETSWVLVAKIDLFEAFSLLRGGNVMWVTSVVVLFSGLMLIAFSLWIYTIRWQGRRLEAIRRVGQRQVAEEQERLAVTLASIADAVISTDTAGRIVMLNKTAELITGWSNEQAVQQYLPEVFRVLDKDSRAPITIFADCQSSHKRSILPEFSCLVIARDGTERRIELTCSLIKKSAEDTLGLVLVFRDIGNRQRVEEELLRTQKLESLGLLAGGIAHDFNNLLGGVFGYIELARESAISGNLVQVTDYLRHCEGVFGRARNLTHQLLTFAKGGSPAKSVGDLAKLIKDTVSFALSGSPVRPHLDIAPDLWACEYDSGQMGQVIENLVINAKQAMPQGGQIEIRAENVIDPVFVCAELSGTEVKTSEGSEEMLSSVEASSRLGKFILISICDHGEGVPPENLPRLFDPFFSTKTNGCGLGLSTAHSIVKKHGGYIDVQSEWGKGSVVRVYLPALVDRPPEEPAISPPVVVRSLNKGRVLVMDDEDYIRDVASKMLHGLGYDVVTAIDGAEAIAAYELAQDKGNPFKLVILDLTIPGGLGGKEALTLLLQHDPKVSAIASSGYSEDPVMASPTDFGFVGKLNKPYDRNELEQVLLTLWPKEEG